MKTQKAKGIIDGVNSIIGYNNSSKMYCGMQNFMYNPKHKLIINEKQAISNKFYPCFARPCPTKPRHGFVESRTITSRAQLVKLWKEVIKQDPNGEIVLGPHIEKVTSNAVYVSSGNLAVGKGNDGATGGKGSISFPVAPHNFTKKTMRESGLKDNDTVYLESILDGDNWLLTQVRGGPAISSVSPDYIPKVTKVKKVIAPHNDLLAWETETKAFKPGTVVYGNGHTLASHAAIHCVLNNIPFVTTFEPIVGKTIRAKKISKIPKLNRTRFKKGIKAGLSICKARTGEEDMLKFFYFSLSVLHNWAYLKHSKHADWLLGAAAILFSKLCASLVHGEFRHSDNNRYISREIVYAETLGSGVSVFSKLPRIFKNFHSGDWTDGYGGTPWANCTWYTYSLWSSIVKAYNKSSINITEREVSNIISVINRTVNIAHNRGWWFNKIADETDMDFAANSPGLAAYCVSELYHELHKKTQNIKTVKEKLKATVKLNGPFAKDKDGRPVWVYIRPYHNKKLSTLFAQFENGKYKSKKIKLSPKEITATTKMYLTKDILSYERLLLKTSPSGQFKIPGGVYRNIETVFGQ